MRSALSFMVEPEALLLVLTIVPSANTAWKSNEDPGGEPEKNPKRRENVLLPLSVADAVVKANADPVETTIFGFA
jgi:hypothetical protein